eukprot:scaffold282950_cov31-Attheya_sp.AAC.1
MGIAYQRTGVFLCWYGEISLARWLGVCFGAGSGCLQVRAWTRGEKTQTVHRLATEKKVEVGTEE